MTTATLSADSLIADVPARATRTWPFQAGKPAPQAPAEAGQGAGVASPLSHEQGRLESLPRDLEAEAAMKEMRRRMIWDVVMVAAWGALIPGLMWLGAAAGF